MFRLLPKTDIDFTAKFPYTSILSTVLALAGLVGLFSQMNYGVDFRGGAEIQVKVGESFSISSLRNLVAQAGFPRASIQSFGAAHESEYIIKVSGTEETLNAITEQLRRSLEESGTNIEIRKVDIVGPKAGAELRIAGLQAVFWALIAVMVYIGLRFDFKYSPGAVVALFHDVAIVLGAFAFTGTEFTLQTVAALLAVVGYSVNDTVIVYDRVREHEAKRPEIPLPQHINNAVNETLSRTILTSGTTLFVSLSMAVWGGAAIRDFFWAVTLGVLAGTYSSIFVAAPVTLFFHRFRKKS